MQRVSYILTVDLMIAFVLLRKYFVVQFLSSMVWLIYDDVAISQKLKLIVLLEGFVEA